MSIRQEGFRLDEKFSAAILGTDSATRQVIYSVSGIIAILMQEGMDEEDACEHFYFEIAPDYISQLRPIFCVDDEQPKTPSICP